MSLTGLVVSIDSDADIAAVANLRYGSLWIGCTDQFGDSLVTDAAFIGEPWGCFAP